MCVCVCVCVCACVCVRVCVRVRACMHVRMRVCNTVFLQALEHVRYRICLYIIHTATLSVLLQLNRSEIIAFYTLSLQTLSEISF